MSLVTTQSELLAHEVYLTDRIDKYVPAVHSARALSVIALSRLAADLRSTAREPLTHLSCIAFLSATDSSVEAVKAELAKPRYGGYWLCA